MHHLTVLMGSESVSLDVGVDVLLMTGDCVLCSHVNPSGPVNSL